MAAVVGRERINFFIPVDLLKVCKKEAELQGSTLTGLILQSLLETVARRHSTLELMRLEHIPEWARRPMLVTQAPGLSDPETLHKPPSVPLPPDDHDGALDSRLL